MKVNELRGRMVAKGLTQEKLARQLGITPKTFSAKLKKGIFNSNEMKQMVDILEISNPIDIFFGEKVS